MLAPLFSLGLRIALAVPCVLALLLLLAAVAHIASDACGPLTCARCGRVVRCGRAGCPCRLGRAARGCP